MYLLEHTYTCTRVHQIEHCLHVLCVSTSTMTLPCSSSTCCCIGLNKACVCIILEKCVHKTVWQLYKDLRYCEHHKSEHIGFYRNFKLQGSSRPGGAATCGYQFHIQAFYHGNARINTGVQIWVYSNIVHTVKKLTNIHLGVSDLYIAWSWLHIQPSRMY